MSDTVNAAASLYGYPTPVQAELARIASVAAAMTDEERAYAAALFATVALHFGLGDGDDRQLAGAHMISALGVLIKHTHDAEAKTHGN